MPKNTIYIGRPTKWGSPLKLINGIIYIDASWRRNVFNPWIYLRLGTIDDMINLYDLLLNGEWLGCQEDMRYWNIKLNQLPLFELKGKDLACFCPPTQPCHGDILVKRINKIKIK